jgi:hypothetical protein
MVNSEELAICRKRGHYGRALGRGWSQCHWCGMWVREVCTIEEREEEPPEDELDSLARMERWKKRPRTEGEGG